MPERDGYIPGVPCWVDTSQPDPEAAAAFYGGLFGWAVEDAMPPGSDGRYFIGRIDGRDAAAISSIPPGAPAMATWNTYIWVDDVDATVATVRDAGGTVVVGAVRRHGRRPDGRRRRSRGCAVLPVAGRAAPRVRPSSTPTER